MNGDSLIPIVAIAGGLSIPIIAMFLDSRRRRLLFEERRAMIEKGMQPPELDDSPGGYGMSRGTPEQRRDRALYSGIISLGIGLGLGLGAFLIGYVLEGSFIPRRAVGGMALGACILTFIGLGNLLYYATTKAKAGG